MIEWETRSRTRSRLFLLLFPGSELFQRDIQDSISVDWEWGKRILSIVCMIMNGTGRTIQQITRTAEKITRVALSTSDILYSNCCSCKTTSIADDPSYTLHEFFTLIAIWQKVQGRSCHTTRLCNSFFPEAVWLFTTSLPPNAQLG